MKAAFTLFFSAVFVCSFAQDAFFTQYNYGWSMFNPAYAGSLGCARAEVGYRLQWQEIAGGPKTFNAAYDQYTKYGGVGGNYVHDEIGLFSSDRFDFNYAYPFVIKTARSESGIVIQPGIQCSYYQKRFDTAGLVFAGPVEVFDNVKQNVFDVSAGLLLYGKRLCFGFATFHLNEPDEGFLGTSRLPMRYVVHASGIFGNTDADEKSLSVVPSALFMMQGSATMFVGMINAKCYGVNLGVGYRYQDAFLLSAAYTWRDITFGYSFDHTISNLSYYTIGSHEFHLRYIFMKDKWSQMRNLRQFM